MKNIFDVYESILDDNFEDQVERNSLQTIVEEETGWTLSSDGKYILSGTKHFPGDIDTYFGNNKEWFEKLISCAKKYKLKIQPLGILVLDSSSIHLLEGVDIEYICELKIYVNNPVKIDLSKIKSPVQRIVVVEKQNSWCNIDSITLQKTPVITTHVDLYAGWEGLQNVTDMNCTNLITSEGRGVFLLNPKIGAVHTTRLQQFVNSNPKVTNFYIKTLENKKEKYYQVKLKGKEVVGVMGKSENTLVSKGVLEDFYLKNGDFRQWYEKHM